MNTTLEILRRARELIGTPDKWCQNTYFTADGRTRLVQAISTACHLGMGLKDLDAYMLSISALGFSNEDCAISFNDSHSYEEVIQMLDRAIEMAKEKDE